MVALNEPLFPTYHMEASNRTPLQHAMADKVVFEEIRIVLASWCHYLDGHLWPEFLGYPVPRSLVPLCIVYALYYHIDDIISTCNIEYVIVSYQSYPYIWYTMLYRINVNFLLQAMLSCSQHLDTPLRRPIDGAPRPLDRIPSVKVHTPGAIGIIQGIRSATKTVLEGLHFGLTVVEKCERHEKAMLSFV